MQTRFQGFPRARYLLRLTAVFFLYLAAGKLGLSVPFTSGNVSPVWPASGIALAAVLLWGYGIWPGIAAAAFLVNFWSPIPPLAALGIAVGNTSSALVGGYLLRRAGLETSLVKLRDVLALVVLGALASTPVAATGGTTTLFLTHVRPWAAFWTAWRVWWFGDAMGVLIVAPLFLTGWELRRSLGRARGIELLSLLLSVTATSFAIFSRVLGVSIQDDVLAFAVFPFVIWAAIRFRVAGASAVSFLIAAIAVCGTALGYGPFVEHSPVHNAVLLQLFLAVISITGLMLAAVISERLHISEALETRERLLRELELTEKSLKENQTRLELAQKAARMGVWEWDLGTDEVVWSLGAPALYGVAPSTFRLRYEDWLGFVHPGDRDAVRHSVEDALAGEKEHDLEFRTVLQDGSVRWLAGRGKVFRDAFGAPVRMTEICIDVTELKQAQEALREAHDELEVRVRKRTAELAESNRALSAQIAERIQAQEALELQTRRLREQSQLLDLANDGIFIRSLDGSIYYWNEGAERLYGWSRQEALAKPLETLLQTEFPLPFEEVKEALFRDGSWEGELIHARRDGTRVTVASRWTLWRNQEGTPLGWLQINSDISERKQAEHALRELSGRLLHLQDEERRRLARELHDSTGQSLTALQMNLAVVRQRASGIDGRTSQVLLESMDLAEQVVKEIRTLSYLLHPPLLDEVGLASALRWYVDGLAGRSKIQIDLDLSPHLGRLSQDLETAIFRIVQECLTNIHRHSGSSTAKIQIDENGNRILLSVRDQGKGISSEFLRGANGTPPTAGVGIRGMRERVRELGGRMRIRSGAPGTTVEVVLPLARREPLHDPRDHDPRDHDPRDGDPRDGDPHDGNRPAGPPQGQRKTA
jgi:PAS domain S-box-containing protein